MRALRYITALGLLPMLIAAGCGGGGGGSSDSTTPPPSSGSGELPTYGTTNLPGHLVVQSATGPATSFDLRTGQRASLPTSATGGNTWYGSTNPGLMLRVSNGGPNGTQIAERVRTTDWTAVDAPTNLPGSFTRPKVSPDGKYILTFWQPGSDPAQQRLTIFSTESGQRVKQGSQLDGELVTSSPAGWLPNGHYVYLAGRRLYESSPEANGSTLVATLSALPDNSASGNNIDVKSNGSQLSVSPDGQKIAFSWTAPRPGSNSDDSNIWIAQVDGTGLHQLTSPPDSTSPLNFVYGNATWSPDSQWVAAALYMNGVSIAPIFPPDQSFPGVPGGIVGATGCAVNPVFVLPASAEKVAISWPTYDARYGLKVRSTSGTGGQWISACSMIQWVQ